MNHKWARRIKTFAFWLLGFVVFFWTVMGLGAMLRGDFSAIVFLIPAALIGAGLIIAMSRVLLAGTLLAALGLLTGAGSVAQGGFDDGLTTALTLSGPILIGGLLLVIVGVMEQTEFHGFRAHRG